jgi:hypothetical protein
MAQAPASDLRAAEWWVRLSRLMAGVVLVTLGASILLMLIFAVTDDVPFGGRFRIVIVDYAKHPAFAVVVSCSAALWISAAQGGHVSGVFGTPPFERRYLVAWSMVYLALCVGAIAYALALLGDAPGPFRVQDPRALWFIPIAFLPVSALDGRYRQIYLAIFAAFFIGFLIYDLGIYNFGIAPDGQFVPLFVLVPLLIAGLRYWRGIATMLLGLAVVIAPFWLLGFIGVYLDDHGGELSGLAYGALVAVLVLVCAAIVVTVATSRRRG